VGGQRPILAPLHRNLEGHSPSLPYRLFHPWNVHVRTICDDNDDVDDDNDDDYDDSDILTRARNVAVN